MLIPRSRILGVADRVLDRPFPFRILRFLRTNLEDGSGGTPPPDLATSGADGLAYYSGDLKLIRTSAGEHRLFDLSRDPTEANDLADARPEVVETLAAKLDAFPRGEDVALPLWRVILDPDEFGGEERGAPMADRTRP